MRPGEIIDRRDTDFIQHDLDSETIAQGLHQRLVIHTLIEGNKCRPTGVLLTYSLALDRHLTGIEHGAKNANRFGRCALCHREESNALMDLSEQATLCDQRAYAVAQRLLRVAQMIETV